MLTQKLCTSLSLLLALVTCPGHLPLTLPLMLSLTAGTALGAWLAQNPIIIVILTTLAFSASLLGAGFFNRGKVCNVPTQSWEKVSDGQSV